jgi:hypothetical protein
VTMRDGTLMVPSQNRDQELTAVTNRHVGNVGAGPYAYTCVLSFDEPYLDHKPCFL